MYTRLSFFLNHALLEFLIILFKNMWIIFWVYSHRFFTYFIIIYQINCIFACASSELISLSKSPSIEPSKIIKK
ncbi:hypothetical protein BpHYR1_031708 [Brachionus plicatilis]|uniref:Uncharacterized protein n=1 Tax=Brachionus plicatilis TaxID=10195 RepID=A0A3M7QNX4_BRAPC|nr:hypothetical protein BpHYR1_031708 [Brachionus plicatilis]